MQSISKKNYDLHKTQGLPAEMKVRGTTRGGYLHNGVFYYHGSISQGAFSVTANETLKISNR